MTDYGGDDDDRVSEWENGLPSAEDLTPLSQHLIPPGLFSAFSITPEPHRSMLEVNRASQNTMTSLRGNSQVFPHSNQFNLKSFDDDDGREWRESRDPLVVEADDTDLSPDGSDSRKVRRIDGEEADSALPPEDNDDSSAKAKKARLVWTPQLHKRFVEVVAHLGIKNAVPKTIMQLMNVEGLTRENVASHLQKYRLYLKRMEGCPNEDSSVSDHLFASTQVPQSIHDSGGSAHGNGHSTVPIEMSYPPQMVPYYGHLGMQGSGIPAAMPGSYHGFESHPYNMVQHRDRPADNFGPYRHS